VDILGVDYSSNMIEQARADYKDDSHMLFEVADASKDLETMKHMFDLVFSNACIQWVPNHDKLINDIINAVKSGGYLAIQQPYNYDEPIYLLIRETIASSRWKSRINDSRTFYHLRANDYYDLLATRCEDINVWMTTYKHTMPSHEAILDWYRGTGLRPYIQALGDDKESIQEFEKDILDRIVTAYPKQKDGNIIFDFPRLFFTAKVK